MKKLRECGSFLWKTRAGNRLLGGGIFMLLGVLAGCAAAFEWDVRIFPPCAVLRLTGYRCPGCGGTRMVEALLQGDILLALRYNPLLFFAGLALMGALLWFVLRTFRRGWKPVRISSKSRHWLWIPAVILLFAVVRNMGWYRQWFY